MRVGVIGCGAVGSLFAAHLGQLEDVETWVYDVDERHVAAINSSGLRLTGLGEVHSWPTATTDPAELPALDFGIIATKGMHTDPAIRETAHAFADGAVCSVQNGIGNEEVIAEHVERVIRGITLLAGRLVGPGLCHWDTAGKTWIGPFEPKPASMEAVESLADVLARSRMETVAMEDARGAQWTKLIFNAASNALCALTCLPYGHAASRTDVWWIMERVVEEGRSVASALGIALDQDPAVLLKESIAVAFEHRPSMLQDVQARRSTEIDQLNGGITRYGEQVRVPTPLNKAAWALVRGLEASWHLKGD